MLLGPGNTITQSPQSHRKRKEFEKHLKDVAPQHWVTTAGKGAWNTAQVYKLKLQFLTWEMEWVNPPKSTRNLKRFLEKVSVLVTSPSLSRHCRRIFLHSPNATHWSPLLPLTELRFAPSCTHLQQFPAWFPFTLKVFQLNLQNPPSTVFTNIITCQLQTHSRPSNICWVIRHLHLLPEHSGRSPHTQGRHQLTSRILWHPRPWTGFSNSKYSGYFSD